MNQLMHFTTKPVPSAPGLIRLGSAFTNVAPGGIQDGPFVALDVETGKRRIRTAILSQSSSCHPRHLLSTHPDETRPGSTLTAAEALTFPAVHGVRGSAELLESRFRLIWQGQRTAVPRHQTLKMRRPSGATTC
jgi:hypothetical protein